MNIKTVKKIGEGVYGTIYKAKYNNKDTIVKIEKLGDDFSDYREQVRFDVFARKHPTQFMILEAHGIINDCKHNQIIPDYIEGEYRKTIIEKNKSFECYYLIYSPIYKNTLYNVFPKLHSNYKLYTKFLYQIINQLLLLHDAKITHNDIHTKNIMCDKDYNFHLIDYGRVIIFEVDIKDKKRKNELNESILNDMMSLLNCIIPNSVLEYMADNKYNIITYDEQIKYLSNCEEWQLVNKYLCLEKMTDSIKTKLKFLLIILLYYDVYLKCINFTEVDLVKIVSLKGKLQGDEILFIIKNINNKEACLIYLKPYIN